MSTSTFKNWICRSAATLNQQRRHVLSLILPWALLFLLGMPLLWIEIETAVEAPALRARDGILEEAVRIVARTINLLRHDVVFLADLPESLMRADTVSGSVPADLFLSFSRSAGSYDQIRWIDEHGDERLRVTNRDGRAEVAPQSSLQNKADRLYFRKGSGLPDGNIFFSDLDLNLDRTGAIEHPFQPILRVASPVVDDNGKRHGVIVLNYRAKGLLERLHDLGVKQGIGVYLVNRDGYWVNGPVEKDNWAWELGAPEHTVAQTYPLLWRKISKTHLGVGTLHDATGDWTFSDLSQVEGLKSWENNHVDAQKLGLYVLVHLPPGTSAKLGWHWKLAILALTLLGVTIAIAFALRLARSIEAESQRIGELEQANAALIEAGRHLQLVQAELARSERLSSLGMLVAGVAHEMNTPLGSATLALSTAHRYITELIETAKTGLKRSDLERYLSASTVAMETARDEIKRAAGIVQRFKQVAVDRALLERRTFDLAETILDADPRLRHWDPRSAIELRLDLSAVIMMNSYPGPLGQVVSNLLANALLHAFDTDASGHISIAIRQDGPAHALLSFADNGKGIPKNDLGRVFEPFFTTGRHKGSTGLGLHIVHELVTEVLGGHIKVDSVPVGENQVGKINGDSRDGNGGESDVCNDLCGTTFTIRLPLTGPESRTAPP